MVHLLFATEAGGTMAEVGLLPFARIALQVAKAVLPRYRSRFSKHQFNQPQLLAVLCLMRYEDWTLREAEVRLSEHRELRQALGLGSVPDFTTLYRFLQRLDDQTIDRAVGETVRRLRGTQKKRRRRASVSVGLAGLGHGLADAEFDSESNHPYIRKQLGAQSVIPAKRGKKTWRIHGVRAEMRRAFPRRIYRRRSLIESLFSSVKRKLSARAPGRSLHTQKRQALLLGLSFNLYRLWHR